jgi:alkanesulfonate monooxygenase SsuD/methylene tetrahydromethanopterin reductase-like flavin-dependent oxidoreductase (luciferase family)
LKFGTLLPHFGPHASPRLVLKAAELAESLGFDSLWARDALVWRPVPMEDPRNRTFLDSFGTLAAVSSITERPMLGTAVAVPIRWPLQLAHAYATLSQFSAGRVIAGIGLRGNAAEMAAVGFSPDDDEQIFADTVSILRKAWAPGSFSFESRLFHISDVDLQPKPVSPIPIVYGGTTPAAVRRAVEYCDGWLCSRAPLRTMDHRLPMLRELSAAAGRDITVYVKPLVVVGRGRNRALERVSVTHVVQSSGSSKWWVKPPSGEFRTMGDIEGVVIAGTPADIVAGIRKFQDRGVDHFVFDLRLQFDEYISALETIGNEIIPAVKAASPVA